MKKLIFSSYLINIQQDFLLGNFSMEEESCYSCPQCPCMCVYEYPLIQHVMKDVWWMTTSTTPPLPLAAFSSQEASAIEPKLPDNGIVNNEKSLILTMLLLPCDVSSVYSWSMTEFKNVTQPWKSFCYLFYSVCLLLCVYILIFLPLALAVSVGGANRIKCIFARPRLKQWDKFPLLYILYLRKWTWFIQRQVDICLGWGWKKPTQKDKQFVQYNFKITPYIVYWLLSFFCINSFID